MSLAHTAQRIYTSSWLRGKQCVMAAWHAYRLAASNYLHLQVSASDTHNLQQSRGAFWCTVMQVNISASNDSYRINRNSPKCQFAAPGWCWGQLQSVSSAASITTRSKRVTGKQHAGRGIYRLRNCESLLKDMIVAKAWMRPSILWCTMLRAGSELKEQRSCFMLYTEDYRYEMYLHPLTQDHY